MGRQRSGRQGRSPGRCSAAMDGCAASPRHPTVNAQPAGSPVQQAPVAAQPFYHGFPRPPYQGQRPYQGRAYHPYQCAPVPTQGRGHGRGRGRGPGIYQAQPPNLPPVVAEQNWLNGTPPNDLHFADNPYGQEAFLSKPPFERWVTGYSHDSHPLIDANQAYEYDYAPKASYEDNQDYDYYGEEEE